MKEYNFYALAARMKYINRWGLMRNTEKENVKEHSLDVAIIAHALAVINNTIFGGTVDAGRTALMAIYHDMSEIITGDMPTPVKYNNSGIISAYKEIEAEANRRLLDRLPEKMRGAYEDIFFPGEEDEYIKKLVKAADKISAYIKCIEEESAGNKEFTQAKSATEKAIEKFDLPEVKYFMETFIPAYYLTLDEI